MESCASIHAMPVIFQVDNPVKRFRKYAVHECPPVRPLREGFGFVRAQSPGILDSGPLSLHSSAESPYAQPCPY